MNIIVVGNESRTHAIVRMLCDSKIVERIICAPGNPGIYEERVKKSGRRVECYSTDLARTDVLESLACNVFQRSERQETLVVFCPEEPLIQGAADRFTELGFKVYGPNKRAARLEGSKIFSHEFMERHNVPNARGKVCRDIREALVFVAELGNKAVIKWPYPARGKGAFPCRDIAEVGDALRKIFVQKLFAVPPGEELAVLVQEFLEGEELSLEAVVSGGSYIPLAVAHDYKRAWDGDTGPMTGGMGAYSPVPFLSERALEQVQKQVFGPIVAGCLEDGLDFCGTLFPGIMLTSDGPKALEINGRFGRPEAEAVLPRLQSDLAELLLAAAEKRLDTVEPLKWDPRHAVCIVAASKGYPESCIEGHIITGVDEASQVQDVHIFHAGTNKDMLAAHAPLYTAGGRVFAVTALRPSLEDACDVAREAVEMIRFEGRWFRTDIGRGAIAAYAD